MILVNGSTETEIDLSHMKVSVKLPIRNKDQSGDSTATDTTSQGTKAKVVSVSGRIAKSEAEKLRILTRLAEAEDDTGGRVQYLIQDETAEAMDVRTVIFHEDLDAREMNDLHAWAITFSLREIVSVPEVKQQRAAANTISASNASATGQTVTPETQAEQQAEEIAQNNGTLWNLAKKLDDFLAPDDEEGTA